MNLKMNGERFKMICKQNNCDKDLIEKVGICEEKDVSEIISKYPFWKQIIINETLEIPEEKPNIETLNSVTVSWEIIRSDVIKTPRTYDDFPNLSIERRSLSGMLLSGRKLIIEGVLCEKISYTADKESQSVHNAHFYIPFSSYIVVPKEIENKDSLEIKYQVNACIEDIYLYKVGLRKIVKKVIFLLYAVPTDFC